MKLENLAAEQIARKSRKAVEDLELASEIKTTTGNDPEWRDQAKVALTEVQNFITSDKSGPLLGEALEEHTRHLKKEIAHEYETFNDSKAAELRRELVETNSAYDGVSSEYISQRVHPSFAQRWNRIKESIRDFFH